jgi:hypothetical protein
MFDIFDYSCWGYFFLWFSFSIMILNHFANLLIEVLLGGAIKGIPNKGEQFEKSITDSPKFSFELLRIEQSDESNLFDK